MPDSIKAILQISKQDRLLSTKQNLLKNIPEKKKKLRIPVRRVEIYLDKLKEQEEEIYGKIRERETLVSVENEKIKKSDEKMLAVKNQKEYLASQKEIDIAKKTIKKVEDQILELEEQKEKVSKQLAEALEEYRKEKDSMTVEEQKVLEVEKEIMDIIEVCNQNKAEVISKVDPEIYKEYEKLIKRKLIPAAVEISSASCLGCAMSIPAQLFNEIIRDLSGKCPHCGRLLFYKAPEKPKEEVKKKGKAKKKTKK